MRQLDETKVLELMTSYESVGVINPISVDEELTLIAGAHRLEAAKNLGWDTIEAKVFDDEDLQKELIEIDENLIRNELCYIAAAEHIQERERILTSLGTRRQRGSNRYTGDDDQMTTDDLAGRIGVSNKMYRMRRQVADLSPETRNALRGTDYARRSLNDLLNLCRQDQEVQRLGSDNWCRRTPSKPCGSISIQPTSRSIRTERSPNWSRNSRASGECPSR